MNANKPFGYVRHRGGGRWATLVAGFVLAAVALSPPVTVAAVIDDFDGDQPLWDGWNPPTAPSEPPALAELVSKCLRISAHFTTPTDPANLFPHVCNVYYSRSLPLHQEQTLKLRADLAGLSRDNVFACLITMDTKGGEYILMRDANEIALLKWSPTDGFSVAFWETQSQDYLGGVLMLALRPGRDDLLIETTIFNLSTGETLFQRTVRDTPASDWGVPDPLPHGWDIFGPDVGPPYRGDLEVVGLRMAHDTDGQQGPAWVLFDNLESRTGVATTLTIEKTVTLSWPHDTVDEMIVVGADSVDPSVWTPYPAPIAKQFGQLCITVPTTQSQQIFKLVYGTHFIDDLSEAKQPFATRQEYRIFFQDPGENVTFSNGVIQVSRTGATIGGVAILPPEDVVVGDFYTSVDVLSMTSSTRRTITVYVFARGRFDPNTGYFGGFILNREAIQGNVGTSIFDGGTERRGPAFRIEANPPPYRIEFSCVGQSLRLRVRSLITKEIIAEHTSIASAFTEGFVGLWVAGPNNDPATHDEVILDNYFVTGTTP